MIFNKKNDTLPRLVQLGILLLFFTFFNACQKDENPAPKSDAIFKAGIYIANEGPFQNGSGTVTYWNKENGSVSQRIFETANNGEQVGNVLQSLYFVFPATVDDELRQKVFLVVNNSNKVVVADKDTFKKQAEITGFALPRYLQVVSSEKAVVTQWGADGLSGSVAVVNLQNNRVEKTIPTGSGPEGMLFLGDNQLLVANSGGWGRDSTIAIVNLESGTVTSKLTVGDNPVAIRPGNQGEFWVICRGHTEDYTNPDNPLNTKGRLVKIKDNAVVLSLELKGSGSRLAMDLDNNSLFYLDSGQIYHFDLSQNQLEELPFVEGFYYTITFDPQSATLLASNPKDFASDGEVIVFSREGSIRRAIPAGIVPGHIWVRP